LDTQKGGVKGYGEANGDTNGEAKPL